jgi:hypothetical protein
MGKSDDYYNILEWDEHVKKLNKQQIPKPELQPEPEPKSESYFLSDFLSIDKSASNDKNITKLQAKIYDKIFDTFNKEYTTNDIKDFIKSLSIPESTFEYIQKWFINNEHPEHNHTVEYSDFVQKVIYPLLKKNVPNTDKVKLMFYANDIAHDSYFFNHYQNQINKYRIIKTFNKLIASKPSVEKLYVDLMYTSSVGNTWATPNYKPNFTY